MKLKQAIISYLNQYDYIQEERWYFGGSLEREVSVMVQAKPSNISRELRRLAQDGILETKYVPNPSGKGARVVQYRLKMTGNNEEILKRMQPMF